MEDLSVWALMRLGTLLSVARQHTRMERAGGGDDGGEDEVLRIDDVLLPKASVAKSFVDKSFDQLSDACGKCGWRISAYATPCGGVAISLWATPDESAPCMSSDAADAFYAATVALVRPKVDLEGTVNSVLKAGATLWCTFLRLATVGTPDPLGQLGAMGGAGLNPEMLKMMLASAASGSGAAARPHLSEHDALLKDAILRIRVSVVSTDASSSTASITDDGVVVVAVPEALIHEHPVDAMGIAIVRALQEAVAYWHRLGTPDGYVAAPQMHPSTSIPPLLLFAGIISADRKQKSSMIRFPQQLLEQVLWTLHGSEETSTWLDRAAYDSFHDHRLAVEHPAPVDEEPRDDESDEEYFARLRPKTYLDLCATYMPRAQQ